MQKDYYTVIVKGKEYEAFYNAEHKICIKTDDFSKTDSTFTQSEDGFYTKTITKYDISEVYSHKVEYYHEGVKVCVWGMNNGRCTIALDDKAAADRIGGFKEKNENYLFWYYKEVDEKEVDAVVMPPKSSSYFF